MSDQDHLLLQQTREGNIDAVNILLRNHQHALFRVAYSILLNGEQAGQAVQEALLSAIYTPGKHPANEPFEIWLKSLVVRAAQHPPHRRAAAPAAAPPPPDENTLWSAYQKLALDAQIPLALRYFHGYAVEQIASLMRVGPNTVRTRLGKARTRLLAALNPSDAQDPPGDETASASSIGHDQARFLLQSAVDGQLSAQEWVPLQSHLDHCENCRVYRRKIQSLERDLQHALRAHLEAPGAMPIINAEKLLARQRTGMRSRTLLRSAGKAIGTILSLGIGLLLAYAIFIPPPAPSLSGTMTADSVMAARITATPEPTPTPPIVEPFRTPVLFQSSRDGNNEIYLLDPDGQAVNLTRNPASDTAPVWSPDGEWLAFLSDRSGKNEVYLLRVSGSQLTQVTDAPEIAWEAPISWSGNGARLAVTGRWSKDSDQSWLYLVDLKRANELVRLTYTRGASQPRWAPEGSQIAYMMQINGAAQLFTRRVDRLEAILVNDAAPNDPEVFQVTEGAFDWAPTRVGIVFVSQGPYRVSRSNASLQAQPGTAWNIETRPILSSVGADGAIALAWKAPDGQKIASASWSPQNLLALLRTDPACGAENGWALAFALPPVVAQFYTSEAASQEPLLVPGVCAAGPLSDSAWSSNGRWLVFLGAANGENTSSLYALDVIKSRVDLARDTAARLPLLRLNNTGPEDSLPQVRPQAAQLGINPTAAHAAPPTDPLPAASLDGAPGRIFFSALEQGNWEVFSTRPDGSERANLTKNPADDRLVAVQPGDPGGIAFSSDRGRARGGPPEIFAMDLDGGNPTQLTNVETDPRPYATLAYGGFSWSADGTRLATEVINQNGKYLVLMPRAPAPGEAENQYFQLQGDLYSRPLWMENGQKIYMASSGGYAMGLILVDPAAGPMKAIDALRINWPEPNWGRVNAMISIPQTGRLAFLATRQLSGAQEATIGIFDSDPRGEEIRLLATLQIPNQQYQVMNTDLVWLPETEQFLVHAAAPVDQKIKSTLTLVDAATGSLTPLWQTEDYAFSVALSPDERWLLYSTETGLWALNIRDALGAKTGPALVTGGVVSGFGWLP